jgi:cytochrome b561
MSTVSSDVSAVSDPNRVNSVDKHPLTIRLFHWLMAFLVIGMIGSGLIMVRLDDANPLKYDVFYIWHQSFGILVFGIGSLRLVNRLRSRLAPLPASIAPMLRRLAKLTYMAFYVLLITMPISGLIMSSAYPDGGTIPFFGLEIASFTGPDKALYELSELLHRVLGYVFGSLIILHVLASLKHRFFDAKGNDVLARML